MAAITLMPFVSMTAAAQMSTTTLGTQTDTLSATVVDYFSVLVTKYWPFVVGFGILLVVWHFGRRIIASFT